MPARHRSRMRAAQVLYQWDMRLPASVEDSIDAFYRTLHSAESEKDAELNAPVEEDLFMEELVRGTASKVEEIDLLLEMHSQNWRLERMPAVDRNILRLAIFEMRSLESPPAVVIDEALDIAHQLSGEDSAKFINGVLDAVRKQLGQ